MFAHNSSLSFKSSDSEGTGKLCLICAKQLGHHRSISSVLCGGSSEPEMFKDFTDCMNLDLEELEQDDLGHSRIGFCLNCRTTLDEWKCSRDQEIRWRLKTAQLKATLTATLVESFQNLRIPEGHRSGGVDLFERIRSDVKRQYVPDVRLERRADIDPALTLQEDDQNRAQATNSISEEEIVCGQCHHVFRGETDGKVLRNHVCAYYALNNDEGKHLIMGDEIDHHLTLLRHSLGDCDGAGCDHESTSALSTQNIRETTERVLAYADPKAEMAALIKIENQIASNEGPANYFSDETAAPTNRMNVEMSEAAAVLISNPSNPPEVPSESAETLTVAARNFLTQEAEMINEGPSAETDTLVPPIPEQPVFAESPPATTEQSTLQPARAEQPTLEELPVQFIIPLRDSSNKIPQNSSVTSANCAPNSSPVTSRRPSLPFAKTGSQTYSYAGCGIVLTDDKCVCSTCSLEYKGQSRLSNMKEHIRKNHLGLYIPQRDVTEVEPGLYLYKNQIPFSKTSDSLICGLCKFETKLPGSVWTNLMAHMKKHCTNVMEEGDRTGTPSSNKFPSSSKGKKFWEYSYFGISVKATPGKHTCGKCGKTFGLRRIVRQHIFGTHAGLFSWSKNVTETGPNEYLYRDKIPFNLRDGSYVCGICHKSTPLSRKAYKYLFMGHLTSVHRAVLEPESSVNEESTEEVADGRNDGETDDFEEPIHTELERDDSQDVATDTSLNVESGSAETQHALGVVYEAPPGPRPADFPTVDKSDPADPVESSTPIFHRPLRHLIELFEKASKAAPTATTTTIPVPSSAKKSSSAAELSPPATSSKLKTLSAQSATLPETASSPSLKISSSSVESNSAETKAAAASSVPTTSSVPVSAPAPSSALSNFTFKPPRKVFVVIKNPRKRQIGAFNTLFKTSLKPVSVPPATRPQAVISPTFISRNANLTDASNSQHFNRPTVHPGSQLSSVILNGSPHSVNQFDSSSLNTFVRLPADQFVGDRVIPNILRRKRPS